jgi:peptidoglycan biosynthesis protein MviN/MurJ (putative lipid II flippase)
VLFEHGAFGHQQSVEVGQTLQAYLWGLPAAAMIGLLARVRQSRGELKGTAMAAVAVIPLNLVLDVILLPRMGPVGAGYATAAALTLQVILLCRGFQDSVFGLLASIATGIVAAVLMAWLILPEDFRQLARRGNSPADE